MKEVIFHDSLDDNFISTLVFAHVSLFIRWRDGVLRPFRQFHYRCNVLAFKKSKCGPCSNAYECSPRQVIQPLQLLKLNITPLRFFHGSFKNPLAQHIFFVRCVARGKRPIRVKLYLARARKRNRRRFRVISSSRETGFPVIWTASHITRIYIPICMSDARRSQQLLGSDIPLACDQPIQ